MAKCLQMFFVRSCSSALLAITGCASQAPVAPASTTPPVAASAATAPIQAALAPAEPVQSPQPTPTTDPAAYAFDESLLLTVQATPRHGVEFECNGQLCLVLWEEMGIVRTVFYDPRGARGPSTLMPPHPRFSVRVTSLIAHRDGFAFLRWVDEAFERGRLEVVVVLPSGEIDRRVEIGPFYSNGSEPALASDGDALLVGYPRTRTTVVFVKVEGQHLGPSQRTSSTHADSPHVAHDGQRFVTAWLDWERAGPTFRARAFGDAREPVEIPYSERTSLCCGNGSCLLLGTRSGRIVADVLSLDAANEVVLVERIGLNGIARALPRGDEYLVLATDESGTRALEIDARARVVGPSRAMPTEGGKLERFGDRAFASLRVATAPDYEPLFYPCPGDESSTCADLPGHYVITLRLLTPHAP